MQEVVRFLVDTEEKARIEAEAAKLSLTVSAFIRLLLKNWMNGLTFEKKREKET